MRGAMQRMKDEQDIKRLSEAEKSVAVLSDAKEHKTIREELELLADIQISLNQIEEGQGITDKDAKEKIIKRVQL